ncbi:transposon TX1 putative protein, partial [Trifolium medium]|nr:transposon TX1 putative protein [Trifolium medium]
MIRHDKVDFLAIQETKMEEVSENLCYNLWGSEDCDWAFLWRDSFDLEEAGFGIGNWCVVGDFNAVVVPEERRGVSLEHSTNLEMSGFSDFINELNLVDLPLLGRRFTWFHANGRSMSRIDRMLVSPEWMEVWGVCVVWVCPRDISDHCPLILKNTNNDWGPKPFRFNNHWIENKRFKRVVEECWREQQVSGWMGYVLKEKLRGLKTKLKEWNKVEYGNLENKLMLLVEDINDLDVRSETMGLTTQEVLIRKNLFADFWKLQKIKDATLFQRSRVKWISQ